MIKKCPPQLPLKPAQNMVFQCQAGLLRQAQTHGPSSCLRTPIICKVCPSARFLEVLDLYLTCPRGSKHQYFRPLVPKTIPLMVFGTSVLKYWVLGPSGYCWGPGWYHGDRPLADLSECFPRGHFNLYATVNISGRPKDKGPI